MAKGRKVKVSRREIRTRGKTRPTVRLADQLMNTTTEEAAEREPELYSLQPGKVI